MILTREKKYFLKFKDRSVRLFIFTALLLLSTGCQQNGKMNEYKGGSGPCAIYDKTPADIGTPAEVNFGNKVILKGITVDILSEKQAMIAYYWQILDDPGKYKQVFVHFADNQGAIAFQDDHTLCSGTSLSSAKGKSIKEISVIDIPKKTGRQEMNIKIGIYMPEPDYPRLHIKTSGRMLTGEKNTQAIFQKVKL